MVQSAAENLSSSGFVSTESASSQTPPCFFRTAQRMQSDCIASVILRLSTSRCSASVSQSPSVP